MASRRPPTTASVLKEPGTGTGISSRSFSAFFQAEYPDVVTLAAVLSGSRSVAEDMAQDAFAAAYRRWSSIQQPNAWIRRVVSNLAASWIRRRVREAAAIARLAELRGDEPLLMNPEADVYWAAVRALPKRQAQSIALHFLEDRSTAEIAEILDLSEATVRVHLHRGRARLAAALNDQTETQ